MVNCFRPETRDLNGAIEILKEIETAGKLPITAIINNANLGKETTLFEVEKGLKFCEELSKETNLPLAFTSVFEGLIEGAKTITDNLMPVSEILYGSWQK